MSVSATIAKLAQVLEAVDASPQPPLRRVYPNPAEAVKLAEFPCIVIGESASAQHSFTFETAGGIVRHDYTLSLWCFLGTRETPLAELHARALPWAEAIMVVLAANMTLGYTVNQLGPGNNNQPVMTYKIGPIPWGQANGSPLVYWGVTVQLPVVEKPIMDIEAGT